MNSLDRARALLAEHPVIDGHNDLPWAAREYGYDWSRLDIAAPDGPTPTHTDLPRLRQGAVGGLFWSVYVPGTMPGHTAVTATLEQIDGVYEMVARYPEHLALATTADEVEAAFAQGTIASLLGAEGGQSIGESLGALRMLHRLGVRYLTLTHNQNVAWADSATDKPVHHGLSDFGRRVVAEMNRIGMLVDLSHVSADTMRDALETSVAPVIFSHSGARAVTDVPRNVPDDVLASLRDNQGICMAVFAPDFVSTECWQWRSGAADLARQRGIDPTDLRAFEPVREEFEQVNPRPRARLDQVVAHLTHLRSVAGADHLGLGGDYDGVGSLPEGLDDVSRYPYLFATLIDAGWSDQELAGLACRNILRVLREAERVSAQLSTDHSADLTRLEV